MKKKTQHAQSAMEERSLGRVVNYIAIDIANKQ